MKNIDANISSVLRKGILAKGLIVASVLLMCIVSLCAMSGCTEAQQSSPAKTKADFETARLGAITGTAQDALISSEFPQSNPVLYNSIADLKVALLSDKVDGIIITHQTYNMMVADSPTLRMVEEKLHEDNVGFVFPKSYAGGLLQSQVNEFIAEKKNDGTIDRLLEKWETSNLDDCTMPDMDTLTGENGTIKMIVAAVEEPYDFWKDNRVSGFCPELIHMFCEEYGYDYTIDDSPFVSVIAALNAGKYDIGINAYIQTEEREESLAFSTPFFTIKNVLVYNDPNATQGTGTDIFTSLSNSFYKTLIVEDRWKLILEGLGVTFVVALLASILGTILGFGLTLLRLIRNKLLDKIISLYIRIFQGTPVLVMLLIFYYVIFGEVNVSSIAVSVLVFGLNTAAYISEALFTCIEKVDPGQREAAISTGFTETQAFLYFVLPIAVRQALPVYRGLLVSLLKSTSIVGYIALVDLTKVGDIIRSRTYDAFFPLLLVALIYFLMTVIVAALLELLEKKLTPMSSKSNILGSKI